MELQRTNITEQLFAPAAGTNPAVGGALTARRSPLPAFFLRTKLLPPRPTPELLPRPRLTTRLENNLANPITLVTANAGSGKTTLVAEFVAQHGARAVWYQLDHTDADPIVFLGYLTYGLQQAVPAFGAATFAYLNAAPDELAQQPERAVDVLLNEVLEKIEQQVVIVLDDYHHLGLETPVHRVLDRLAAYLPDMLHIIIITRDLPPLALARRRSQARLEIIDRDDLLFTDDETQQLFRQMFDLDLSPAQLAEYRARTQGWITALQLVRQLAQRQALAQDPNALTKPDLVEILRQSERDIFDYFAEEVFADELDETQNLLLRIALLERVELETCARLYPQLRCAAVLPSLVRRNVFVTVARDERGEEYRLHPLFRGFLGRRLRAEIGRAGVAQEHRHCAAYFLGRKSWESALHHLVAAEDFTAAAEILAEHGNEWLAGGALTSLATWAAALPPEALSAHPRALLHWAEVMRLRGDYDQARQLLQRAVKLLDTPDAAEGQAAAWHSLAAIARRRGDCTQTFEYLENALALTAENSPVRVKCANTRALCLKKMGRWSEAEHEFRVALQAAEANGDEHYKRLISHNLGLPAMLRGDFTAALRWLRRMLHSADQTPLPQESVAHLNIARCHFYRGELALCTQHLEQALELCQTFTLRSLEGEIFEAYGNLYREQNDAAHAAEFYERALRAYDAAGIDPVQREIFEEQALLRWQRGDLHGARGLLERVRAGRQADADEMGLQVVSLALCRLSLAQGATAEAQAALPAITEYFHAHQLYYYEAQASLAAAICSLAAGADNVAVVQVRRTLDLAARYDYDYWLRREAVALPQLFGAADIRELLPPDIRELLPPPSVTVAPPAVIEAARVEIVAAPVTDLTIRMLGPVEICRDQVTPLPAEAWTTRRARDILCYIAAQRHRRASKDTLIDVFWGEADFEVVDKNFHPTISHIRKALNYQQKLKQNFLLYQDGAYQFSPNFSYLIDTEEFERLVKEGNTARRARDAEACNKAYETALELYRGDFMEGVYDDWAEEQRGYLREQYSRILESLVAAAQKAQDWPRVLDLAQQILRQDQFREDIHAVIMRAHAALGNRAAVKERFQALRVLLRKELGVEPAPETQRAYRDAVR